jgi:hypothetical protein
LFLHGESVAETKSEVHARDGQGRRREIVHFDKVLEPPLVRRMTFWGIPGLIG